MKIPFKLRTKTFLLQPYTCAQERDLLFLAAGDYGDVNKLDCALDICNFPKKDIKNLNNLEKKAILYRLRELSVGSEINVIFTCCKCRTKSDNYINISNIVKPPTKTHKMIVDTFDYDNTEIYSCLKAGYENLNIDEYENLKTHINDYITTFNFDRPCICQKCKSLNHLNISNTDFVIDNMSEESLKSYYKSYNMLVYYGNFTKLDIDTMLPVERAVHMGFTEKNITEKAKS